MSYSERRNLLRPLEAGSVRPSIWFGPGLVELEEAFPPRSHLSRLSRKFSSPACQAFLVCLGLLHAEASSPLTLQAFLSRDRTEGTRTHWRGNEDPMERLRWDDGPMERLRGGRPNRVTR
ncbi:unnamed protein product [Darwinula stevensoni]|uniref:Uncharacterized protein n=1 Tax=Darwinula stevensoni TaxID=69355 RepID=A0A7R9A499_9CRUS|nr:unnamed protein product [Darwinula stevensoni]CAG0883848.1 unnamed protein product [Darwinula stevensoni]